MSKFFGGILLVAGTTIGAAMLALPVSTGFAGFVPSLALLVVAWGFMAYSALLLLEVNLWTEKGGSLISMARESLGSGGAAFAWVTYLFLLYALTTAYVSGSAPIFLDLFHVLGGGNALPEWVGALPLFLLFGVFVYHGVGSVDHVNRVLMVGLGVSYVLLVSFVLPYLSGSLLSHSVPCYLPMATSVVVTSFGFQVIIPSLSVYLDRDVRKLRWVIVIGSAAPLFIYVLWELVVLGVVPLEGRHGLAEAYRTGSNGAQLLSGLLANPWIAVTARSFLFFAIVTSFLGVSLSLSDFLADGLRIRKTSGGRILLCLLTFVPPLVVSLSYPRAFLSALEYAGAYGVVTLLCFLPALMVWRGRYVKRIAAPYKVIGGRAALVAIIAASALVMFLELATKMQWLSPWLCFSRLTTLEG